MARTRRIEDFTEFEQCAAYFDGSHVIAAKSVNILDRMAIAEGPIKTFPLRGIKDSPPCLHDGRLSTVDDTVVFFDVVLGLGLTATEKDALAAFLLVL